MAKNTAVPSGHPARLLSAYGWVVLVVAIALALIGLFAQPFAGTTFFLFVGGIGAIVGGFAIVASAAVIALLTPTTKTAHEPQPEV